MLQFGKFSCQLAKQKPALLFAFALQRGRCQAFQPQQPQTGKTDPLVMLERKGWPITQRCKVRTQGGRRLAGIDQVAGFQTISPAESSSGGEMKRA